MLSHVYKYCPINCFMCISDPDMLCDAIFSPRYFRPPDRDNNGYFDDDLDCVWVIITPEGFGIQFDFKSVDIQFSDIPDCFEDYVEVNAITCIFLSGSLLHGEIPIVEGSTTIKKIPLLLMQNQVISPTCQILSGLNSLL